MRHVRTRRKSFRGLIYYGKARFSMMYEHWKVLRNMEAKGWQTPLECMEGRANMQRRSIRGPRKVAR